MSRESRDWPAPAKINLFLHILGRRDDGYHNLQTAFQFLDYCDRLNFIIRDDGHISRSENIEGLDPESDLTVRAARLLQKVTDCSLGVDIGLDKQLPMGGGLGGGSSDAATTLVALNRLWRLNLPEDRLAALGLQLGADVPVFVRGRAAWAEGVGEHLTPLAIPEPWYLVLVPDCHVSTADLFAAPELTREAQSLKIPAFLSGQGENVFEPVVRQRFPAVDQALDWLSRFGKARMSGTGACVFASFAAESDARQVMAQMPGGMSGFVAKGLNRSPLLDKLDTMSSF